MLEFKKDFVSCIGKKNKNTMIMCQDYTYAGVIDDNVEYVVLADGCSGGQSSELGASMACALLESFLEQEYKEGRFKLEELFNTPKLFMAKYLDYFNKHSSFLKDASKFFTFWVLVKLNDCFYVVGCGDGGVLLEYGDGTRLSKEPFFKNNMPFYPVYLNNTELYTKWLSQHGESEAIIEEITFDVSMNLVKKEQIIQIFDKFPVFFYKLDQRLIKSIFIYSDGIFSFEDKTLKELEMSEVYKNLFMFKNTADGFLKRRVRAYKQALASDGADHFDDLSLAGFICHNQ